MLSLFQSRRIRGSAGEALPNPFKALDGKGTHFRRGQLVLVAAGPGTGKSAFTLTLAIKSEVPCMYFSADSDAFVQLTRAISIKTGWAIEKSAQAVLEDKLVDIVDDLARSPLRFNYSASPSLDDIEREMDAYIEVFGDYPALVVIDNITNVIGKSSEDDPFSGLESLSDYLHDMARRTEACVVGLHHVTGEYNDSAKPIPLSGVKGQITRVPEMVLTLHKKSGGTTMGDILCVSTVKNRNGEADPSGMSFAQLEFRGELMQISDINDPFASID